MKTQKEGRKNEAEEILEEIMAKTLSKIDKISQPIEPGNPVQELYAGYTEDFKSSPRYWP